MKEKKNNIKKTEIILGSEKINKRKKRVRLLKIGLLMLLLFLIVIYFLLGIIYGQGGFSVTLGQEFAKKSGIIIFENLEQKESKRVLKAEKLEFMDNISINWLPSNIDTEADGSHNGQNYIAYTFYVQNQGSETIDYWYSILIDDVVKNVDNAIRVMIFQNGEKKIYAKSSSNGIPETGTIAFYSDKFALVEQRPNFEEGAIDKYTVVIWIEGDDYDCIDALIGGAMMMHMEITEEHKN
ncbi:MAG: hypothetical protein Q4G09_02500 [Clostridia bacterium]|nr:hypothetical protein [Clostridia bacterium]